MASIEEFTGQDDLDQIEGTTGYFKFELIEPGHYKVMIIDSNKKENSKRTGHYLELTVEIVEEGKFKNRKIKEFLNLWNPSEKAVQIAHAKLKDIVKAVGKISCKDSTELHYKRFLAEIDVTEDMQFNRIKNVSRITSGSVPEPVATDILSADEEIPF